MILDIAQEIQKIAELARQASAKAENVEHDLKMLKARLDKVLDVSIASMGLPEGVTYKDCLDSGSHKAHLHGDGKLWCNGHSFDRT